MTAIEKYLHGYLDSKRKLRDIEEERKNLREMLVHITPSYSDAVVKHSSNVNKIPDTIAQLSELDQEYNDEAVRSISQMKEIKSTIIQIDNGQARQVLMKYFILGHSHKEIAIDMRCSDRWERELYKIGVEEAGRILGGEGQVQFVYPEVDESTSG